MAEEPHVVSGIDWKRTFPFTQIFRSFRVAVHPSKLILALAALLAIYLGGTLLDAIWPSGSRAIGNEPAIYETVRAEAGGTPTRGDFHAVREERLRDVRAEYDAKLKEIGKPNGTLGDIKAWIIDQRGKAVEAADKTFETAKKDTPETRRAADLMRDADVFDAHQTASQRWALYRQVNGVGLFDVFANYQIGQLYEIFEQARYLHFVGDGGVLDAVLDFFVIGPSWALRFHPVYFSIFIIYCLVIWSIFGGAIARIAAVQVARDEKISFRQALSFSSAKFLSFVSAPIIPLLIITVLGLLIAAGAAVTFNIPFIGPIIGGGLFFLALGAGFILTLVLVGLVGGFNLMYPTIAVEGSDSFDAISRSFSYVYARPWRMAFYSLVAALYGAVTYLFLRYFLKLMLSATHYFAGIGIFRHANNSAPLWPTLWPDPLTAHRLMYQIDWLTLGPGEKIGAFLLAMWVFLVIALLGAYAISFYFSASTIIYGLMRHEVDATELDDVYLEPTEEEFAAENAGATPIGGNPVDAPVVVIETPATEMPPPAGG